MRPGLSAVDRVPHAVAAFDVVARIGLAGTDPHVAGVLGAMAIAPIAAADAPIEDGLPRRAAVDAFEDAAVGPARVEQQWVAVAADDRGRSAAGDGRPERTVVQISKSARARFARCAGACATQNIAHDATRAVRRPENFMRHAYQ